MRAFVFLFLFVFLAGNVLAIGVIPGSYEASYEPGLEKDFVFDFVLNGKGFLSIEGDLKDYVFLDKDEIWDRESVVVSLKLPEDLNFVGVSNIWIIVEEVRGLIRVNFPYPDRYLDLDLAVPDVNVGEEVLINLKISNFGAQDLNVSPIIEIYFDEEMIESFEGEERVVRVSGGVDYKFSFDGRNRSAGSYLAVVRSGDFVGEDSFRLGEKKLRILNYTKEVFANSVERFEVEVESLWDDKMNEVYAEVRVIDGDGGFDSSIISLGGWEEGVLAGYFDTDGLEGEVSLSVDVFYDGEVESEIIQVNVVRGYGWIWFIASILIFVVFVFFGYRKFFKSK